MYDWKADEVVLSALLKISLETGIPLSELHRQAEEYLEKYPPGWLDIENGARALRAGS